MSQFSEVIQLVRKEQVTLFLGAGFSLEAGAPNSSSLIDAILNQVPYEDKEDFVNLTLDALCQKFVEYNNEGRSALIRTLKPLFNFERKNCKDQISLSHIPHFKRIFTTNYDTLIEDAYGSDCVVIKQNQDIGMIDDTKAMIYKIHGDFDNPDEMILTRGDYDDFYRNQKNELIWDIVKAEFSLRAILFIGYSLDDSNITHLIERVTNLSGKCNQPLFLIAPGMKKAKRKKLESLGVKYYDAKAEDFFKDLFLSLDRNIVKDAKRKRISDSSFHKYCEYRKLQIDLKSTSSKNEISSVKTLDNGEHIINFRVSNEFAQMVMGDKRKLTDSLSFHGIPIPALKIPPEQLLDFKYMVNRVWLSDRSDIASLLIAPTHDEICSQIKIPTRNFREKVNLVRYGSGVNEVTLVLSLDSYTLTMVIEAKSVSDFTINLKVDFSQKYTDNSLAIHWLNLLMALWNNEKVIFSDLLGKGSFSITNPTIKQQQTDFEKRLAYYNNINEIEDLLGKPFVTYEMYSKDNMERTLIILSYLKKGSYTESIPQNATISFEMSPLDELHIKELQVGVRKYCFGITREAFEELEFNGQSIKIPFQHELYRECEVIQRDKLPNGNYSLKIKVLTGYVYKWYSDNPEMEHMDGMETIHLSENPIKRLE